MSVAAIVTGIDLCLGQRTGTSGRLLYIPFDFTFSLTIIVPLDSCSTTIFVSCLVLFSSLPYDFVFLPRVVSGNLVRTLY